MDLSQYGIKPAEVCHNLPVAALYERAVREGDGVIAANGALMAFSGAKTGRSPKDKRIVRELTSEKDIWWGNVNMPLEEASFEANRDIATGFLNAAKTVYVFDGYAGWDPKYRIKVRVICTRAYHALFMNNMLIRPTAEGLKSFGEPDWVIYNAGQMAATTHVKGVSSRTSVALHIKKKEFVILGTEYAGEMKKGVFTILNYLLPKQNALSMHCSANEGIGGDVALFFGLSGTGKTTLSADPNRALIGDDEHGWTEEGVFNFEGGCYAKTVNLSKEREPDIWNAIRFGSILENVIYDKNSLEVDYNDISITENTRCSYPIEYIPNAKNPCRGGHPHNIIFLTCDAFGVLPPVSQLDPDHAMYHFISGYTAKVAGTEMGVTEPQATFSACFGAAFLVWHPTVYAELLKRKIGKYGAKVWLVNTGWSGGGYGVGSRMKLGHTRTIISAILDEKLGDAPKMHDDVFGFEVVTKIDGVPSNILTPEQAWADKAAYAAARQKLAALFVQNFKTYSDAASEGLLNANPRIPGLK